MKKTLVKLDFTEKEIFALLIKKGKDKTQTWGKYLPKMYLIKDLYPECLQLKINIPIKKKKNGGGQRFEWTPHERRNANNQ